MKRMKMIVLFLAIISFSGFTLTVYSSDKKSKQMQELFDEIKRNQDALSIWTLARHPYTPKEVLIELSRDNQEWSTARRGVATNPNTPRDILEFFIKDTDSAVRFGVADNPSTPRSILEKLAYDQDSTVRCIIAENSRVSKKFFYYLSKDTNSFVRMCLASNANVPKEILRKLSVDGYDTVRVQVGENSNTSRDILVKMSRDNSFSVRLSVARNPNTPKETLSLLMNLEGEYELMRKAILENPTFHK